MKKRDFMVLALGALCAAAAKGADGSVALMLANFAKDAIPLSLKGFVAVACRAVDEVHVYEEVQPPNAIGPETILLLVGAKPPGHVGICGGRRGGAARNP